MKAAMMRERIPILLLAALAGFAAQAAAIDWLPATVELSDGASITGSVSVPEGKLLLYDEGAARRYTVKLDEIEWLRNVIEEQGMEEQWMFRESGLDDKVRTGRYYPVRCYETRVSFRDGRELSGHIIARTIYVKADGQTRRFILRYKQEGKPGQSLSDLPYVRSVRFQGESEGVRGTISGRVSVPRGESVQALLAFNRDKLNGVAPWVNPVTGEFQARGCAAGVWDLVVVTNRAVYVYFSRERDAGAARLDKKQVGEIQDWVDKLRDFFHQQRVLYAAGNEKGAFALIWKERLGHTTLSGLAELHRYAVWAMHKPEKEWQIRKRFFVWRDLSKSHGLKRLEVVVSPSLGGHRISPERPDLQLKLELKRAGEPAIPDAPPAGDEGICPDKKTSGEEETDG